MHTRVGELVESPDPDVAEAAIVLLGSMRAGPEALRLVERLEEAQDPERLAVLARAVGGTLSSDGRSEALAGRAVAFFSSCFVVQGSWVVQVACLDGLRSIGSVAAVTVVARVAADSEQDEGLRGVAVGRLGEMGPGAVPHLFRLCFDEAPTGGSVNGRPIRICDEAAISLDELLGGELGVASRLSCGVVDGSRLEAVRAEARRRGYAP
jgi:hypothetical protein